MLDFPQGGYTILVYIASRLGLSTFDSTERSNPTTLPEKLQEAILVRAAMSSLFPHIEHIGYTRYQPRGTGFLKWDILAQEKIECGPGKSGVCDAMLKIHLAPTWFAEVKYKVFKSPTPTTMTQRFTDKDIDLEFFIPFDSSLSRPFTVNPGEAVASVELKQCLLKGCDHRNCGRYN